MTQQQIAIIKNICAIIFIGRIFPHLSLTLKLTRLEMKIIPSFLLMEKQGKRKYFADVTGRERNEKECSYSHYTAVSISKAGQELEEYIEM